MRILLLGANGQVGFELHRSLTPLGEVVAATRSGRLPGGAACEVADLARPDTLPALVARVAPRWIVNAAAYTAVDQAEDEDALAHTVNGVAPGVLGAAAKAGGASVLHFSTDYVFAGDARAPYREDDRTGPLGAYGRSKLDGEQALRDSGARHVLFRTAWVHAARGRNFLRTMLRLAATRERLAVVADQHGAPTPARLLADVAVHAIRAATRDAAADCEGTFHVAAAGSTTWFGFAQEVIARGVEAGLLERAPEVAPVASVDYPTRARRPAYSVLDNGRISRELGLVLPDWRAGVAQCIAEIAENGAARPC